MTVSSAAPSVLDGVSAPVEAGRVGRRSSAPTGPARARCCAPSPPGAAAADDHDRRRRRHAFARRRAGAADRLVPQTPSLPPEMTVGRVRAARPDAAPRLPRAREPARPRDRRRALGRLELVDWPGGASGRSAAASCSGSCSPGPWPRKRRCCCWTSPPARSTSAAARRRWSSSTRCDARRPHRARRDARPDARRPVRRPAAAAGPGPHRCGRRRAGGAHRRAHLPALRRLGARAAGRERVRGRHSGPAAGSRGGARLRLAPPR